MLEPRREAGNRFKFDQMLALAREGRLRDAPPQAIRDATEPTKDHFFPQVSAGNVLLHRAVKNYHPTAGIVDSSYNIFLLPKLLHAEFDGRYKIPAFWGEDRPEYQDAGEVLGTLYRGNPIRLIEALARHQPLSPEPVIFSDEVLAKQLLLARFISMARSIDGRLVSLADDVHWERYGLPRPDSHQREAGRELAHHQELMFKRAIDPARDFKEALRVTKKPEPEDPLLWQACQRVYNRQNSQVSRQAWKSHMRWAFKIWGNQAQRIGFTEWREQFDVPTRTERLYFHAQFANIPASHI
ncbi:hypothetical protein A2631_05775 [Candidatus Daviesbacteria bacterium RIFCSPHIGHO2_01_FULL_44_29]|uniref:Uncharacterized protein n=1 Tax=Candidatus Daviesbacteria bacterium RIFCSPHIGHO2_02_FULL_43_12 TaxID=1797776 RepID=A0A1F5KIH5_9BACT|nr:MAG: hypothetical protein A2631_05775 [Candidatus Daviesbacteria bacterium RIFCSPHIGHO2_01_FULL_44_29]OGE39479.1 MAG: hypothetical protein A3E86_03985 [Candidatus Daviesbacteria bacterium RIFCSPHIGHO2_12_FULL_47_45]OGE40639.1 MAG: hypothetical protein A3D25_05775 [Candidatus Daviesbacteria bacterium RIFCSPHIGHO2_02_FULL_43_12]OGE69864.1 MAG: hypothetical protein A3B55_05650 [Candidatus Daviesbacteria bacterium RIFCSPLOWO2_01_FULL_43_15]